MNKRKVERWFRTHQQHDENVTLVYRREAYEYRRFQWWLTSKEVRELVTELSAFFGVPVPKLSARAHQNGINDYIAHFMVHPKGRHWLHFRMHHTTQRKVKYWATDVKCRMYYLYVYNVPAHTVRDVAVLHEYAHYLTAHWWGHAPHDSLFLSVNEAVHDVYKRMRRKRGTRCAYRIVRNKKGL